MTMLEKIKNALLEWNGEGVADMIVWLDENTRESQKTNPQFFIELAEGMRELWPPGEKDGKWPWRDSVGNLSRRLMHLWDVRKLGDHTIDECLTVSRRYLAQFEDNAKYMQTLKYFILKQDEIKCQNGRRKLIDKSVFADMLENNSTLDDWSGIFESTSTLEQGELI